MNKPLSIQPIPYQGSKRSLAPRIARFFPDRVETLFEPFAGSAAMTIFAASHGLANRFVIGDTYAPLMELWDLIIHHPTTLSARYSEVWHEQFETGDTHFNNVRSEFNETQEPALLLYLVARCVKNAVRFNKAGYFTQSADKRRTGMKPDRLTRTVHAVSKLLHGRTELFCGDFVDCVSAATPKDLIYMDPPYQGTSTGRDKRYAAQLERERLIEALTKLADRGIPYILSYDGRSGTKVYGEPLPSTIGAAHLEILAGRSSQATLNGKTDTTVESLYVSKGLNADSSLLREKEESPQVALFG